MDNDRAALNTQIDAVKGELDSLKTRVEATQAQLAALLANPPAPADFAAEIAKLQTILTEEQGIDTAPPAAG